MEVFWSRSYKLLQSTTEKADGNFLRVVSGVFHGMKGSRIQAQWIRVQLNRSRAPERANVSDAKVLETTRLIFLENHSNGLTGADRASLTSSVVAMIKQPF
jgi:hypothetical protein